MIVFFQKLFSIGLMTSFFLVVTAVGCGSSESETVAEDELSSYLDDHPELAETVEDDVDPAESDE